MSQTIYFITLYQKNPKYKAQFDLKQQGHWAQQTSGLWAQSAYIAFLKKKAASTVSELKREGESQVLQLIQPLNHVVGGSSTLLLSLSMTTPTRTG